MNIGLLYRPTATCMRLVAGRGGAIWKWYKIKMARNAPFLVPHSDGKIAAPDFKMVKFKI